MSENDQNLDTPGHQDEASNRALFEERAFTQRFLMGVARRCIPVCGHIQSSGDGRIGGPRNWCSKSKEHTGPHRHTQYGTQAEHARAMSEGVPDKSQFPFRVDCPDKVDFVKRDSKGNYIDQTLAAMWWSWQEAQKNTISSTATIGEFSARDLAREVLKRCRQDVPNTVVHSLRIILQRFVETGEYKDEIGVILGEQPTPPLAVQRFADELANAKRINELLNHENQTQLQRMKDAEALSATRIERLKRGECLKCGIGPLRETCAYPEACEHPGRELAARLNQALIKLAARSS